MRASAAYAVSIATSMAAGFMSQFGTMTKPLHAGLAAKSGVIAASLARAGIDAGLDTLDGPTGMNRLMVGPDYEQLRDTLTHVEHGQNLRFETASIGEPLLILSSGFRVKRFPNCGSAHRAMDGAFSLKRSARLHRRQGRGDPCPRAGHPSQQSDVHRSRGRAAGQVQPRIWPRLRARHRQLHARRLHRRGRDAPRDPRALSRASTATRSTRPRASSRPRSRSRWPTAAPSARRGRDARRQPRRAVHARSGLGQVRRLRRAAACRPSGSPPLRAGACRSAPICPRLRR